MARRLSIEVPPENWNPTQAVDDPILNGPYDEPQQHWSYQRGIPNRVPERRPASYWYKTKKLQTGQTDLFAEEERDRLELVNRLRGDVRRWRESNYRGASAVTRDLFAYWFATDRPRRLFFCQREAVETIIYLLEIAIPGRFASTGFKNFELDAGTVTSLLEGERVESLASQASEMWPTLVDKPADSTLLPLRRLGCKMATGSGKTVVMAMIVAWAFCNRGRNPATSSYPSGVLICAPNLTVRKRLQVLRPDNVQNYYDAFDLVPNKYREFLNSGRVLVTNWHAFAPKSENNEGGKSYRVVRKGEETADAFTKDRLGELANRLPILVLNDEGHHCWRPKPDAAADLAGVSGEEKKALEEEVEEARVWLAGLDRINNSGLIGPTVPGVLATIDLSATPFFLGASGYPAGTPFPWLVSDFGLIDAIESGLVKIPRLPVLDDSRSKDDAGRPDPKYFRLWQHVSAALSPADRVGRRPKPEAVFREAQTALTTLAGQWVARFEEQKTASGGESFIPPAMILVCDNTNIAQEFYKALSGERVGPGDDGVDKVVYGQGTIFPEHFSNTEKAKHTVRIDTKLLAKIETDDGETKDQAAAALRQLIDTVGKRGGPGEQIRCVVSVSMLTEGWDANNVTNILGIRAFDSQLLCEQVVGRGLRRMSYEVDPQTGKFRPEYVDVYGIPFSLIPFKGKAEKEKAEDPTYHRVFPVPEKERYRITMPLVESYTYDLRDSGIRCDVESLDGLVVNDEPTAVYVTPTRGYEDEGAALQSGDYVKQDRSAYYATVRMQQVVFRVSQLIVEDLIRASEGSGSKRVYARHHIFPEVVRLVDEYIKKKVKFSNGVDPRELAHEKYVNLLRERLLAGIMPATGRDRATLLPIVNSYNPVVKTDDVGDYQTTRPVYRLAKSHLNAAVLHSDWERKAIDVMEAMDSVEAFAPNDRKIGFTIPYEYLEAPHRYEPDFIVRMRGGMTVIIEIKGGKGEVHGEDQVQAKNAAAKKWVQAVNNAGHWGHWEFEICREIPKLRAALEKYATGTDTLPFRFVEPAAAERYVSCVPLTTLRAAAGRWSPEQVGIDDLLLADDDWITWEGHRPFAKGMFVARVVGRSMEPDIPDGSHCLFRPAPTGTRQGKRLLVRHSGIEDSETGGEYTVKVYRSEKAVSPEGDWKHTKITLEPLNPEHDPIVLTPEDENEVSVIAELVEVIGATNPRGSAK